jgi:ADP-ribose pyrophosphatase YjhB (NUDIX family)
MIRRRSHLLSLGRALRVGPSTRRLCSESGSIGWKEARFDGAMVLLGDEPMDGDLTKFAGQLSRVMGEISDAGRRGVWMPVPIGQSAVIPLAAKHGFKYHHAEGETAMLLNWLPTDQPSPVPDFASHVVGVGGMALNDRGEVLVVKEKNAPAVTSQGAWKLPGGLLNTGEEIADGVAREVYEETGVVARFSALLAARHQHGAAFGRDDLYCVCLLDPQTSAITIDPEEIGEARWLPLSDYYESTKATSKRQGVEENFNSFVVRNVLAACVRGDDLRTLGFAGRTMPSPKGYKSGVTGLTSKPEFWCFSAWRGD